MEPMQGPPFQALSLCGLTKRYGAAAGIEAIDLVMRPGEICGLLGPNGAGKTTLLECILGLRRPDSGTIHVYGVDACAEPCLARAHIGAQLQEDALQDQILPLEALCFFARFHKAPEDAEALLDRFQLRDERYHRFVQLSSGNRRKLLLALALIGKPKLLLLDEPTSGLDPRARSTLATEIRAFAANGGTVLLSTHDLQEAATLCDRVAILDSGRLVACGTPGALLAACPVKSTLRFRLAPRLSHSQLAAIPGFSGLHGEGDDWLLSCSDATASLKTLTHWLTEHGCQLEGLQLRHTTLEDVFMERTGKSWPDRTPSSG